jgi:uncharacterized membrane protein
MTLAMTGAVRWTRILGALLVLSLGVNVFLSGWVASSLWYRPPPPGPMVERFAARLSADDAKILRAAFAAVDRERARAPDLHARVVAALRAEPFDPVALDKALADEFAGLETFGERLRGALVQAAERMSPAGRLTLAEEQGRPPFPPPR